MIVERDMSLAYELWGLSAVVTKTGRRDLEQRLGRQKADIRAIEHGILRHLQTDKHTLAYLSRAMGVAPSSLVPVLDRLENKGLIRRNKDPKDRRRLPVTLTKEGEELLEQVPAVDDSSVLVSALRSLSKEQQQQLLLLLRSFVSALTNEPEETNEHPTFTQKTQLKDKGGSQ